MMLNKVLAVTSVALGALLVTQVVYDNMPKQPQRKFHASWVDNANTAPDGVAQSDHVVQATVESLEKGPNIEVLLPDEPEGKDVIPTTIVKLKVVKTYKGGKAVDEVVELVQTGGGTDAVIVPAPPEADEALEGKGKAHTPVKGRAKHARPEGGSPSSPSGPTSKETRATILEDDPPYQIGEKYVLFLKNINDGSGAPAGPLSALRPGTVRALAPEGRYQITKQDHLKPATTKKGFAPNWQGKHISELEAVIGTGTP